MMSRRRSNTFLLAGALCLTGCANSHSVTGTSVNQQPGLSPKPATRQASSELAELRQKALAYQGRGAPLETGSNLQAESPVQLTGHKTASTLNFTPQSAPSVHAEPAPSFVAANLPQTDIAQEPAALEMTAEASEMAEKAYTGPEMQFNLPTALSIVGGQHPAVGFAQWRVQEAYAQLERAQYLWLPSIQPGFSFSKHDGNYQASNGDIVDVHRNSFQYGLGAGAIGAGTTPRPGLVAQFHLADAIFQPAIAEKNSWAREHLTNAVFNSQLLSVATAYLQLLRAEQDQQILRDTRVRTSELARLTSDFAVTGQGLQADADRLQTELALVDARLVTAREETEVASVRLVQALSLDGHQRIVPMDPTVVPLEMVNVEMDRSALISTGLTNRPELKESQALVAVACEEFQRQKYAPFVPSVLLGFSTGEFGGGTGNSLGNVSDRYDFDAMLTWEIRNLGLGEKAAQRESQARVEQARYNTIRVMDQVAQEVSESHAQARLRRERVQATQRAIQTAEDSYNRNVARIRDGQGLPLEALQSLNALEQARRAYLDAVVDYNEAQFRLQWALGWPVTAPVPPAAPAPTPEAA